MTKPILSFTFSSCPTFEMIFVEGSEFLIGGKQKIKVSSFYLGKYQVTQAFWQAIMGNNQSQFNGDNRPVETVSWNDAKGFIKKLNDITGHPPLGGRGFRLPTEAEWEFAARGGIYSQGYDYCGSDKLKQVGWYTENSNSKTHDVGLLLANELGLYDMSGNVREWCEDDFHSDLSGAPTDGSAWTDFPNRGDYRVIRGGGWNDSAGNCRPTGRGGRTPDSRFNDYGFRLALLLQSFG